MDHVIIVGAGICGLSLAGKLLDAGYSVSVVEARDRIGGRIHTMEGSFSRPVEAGAEFIHGKQPLTTEILNDAKGNKVSRKGTHYTLADGELQKGDLMDDHWKAFFSKLRQLTTDATLDDFLHQYFSAPEFTDLQRRVRQFAEGFDIADTRTVSAMALCEEWANTDEEDQHHVENGYQVLVRYLAEKVRKGGGVVHLSSPVETLIWKKGTATAVTPLGRFGGDKVVITVPPGVLQRGGIRFDPALPRHQEAFNDIGFGGVIKFLFEFRDPFWETGGRRMTDASFIFSDAGIPTWWTQRPESSSLITGWLGGPASFVTDHDMELLFDKAIQSLSYISAVPPAEVMSLLRHWHIADWTTDPFSLGAYSFPTLGTKRAVPFLSLPVDDTLYFAGEALYDGTSGGTVEAALSSSATVFRRILR